ncbi:hypothetical protein QUQ70_000959 [Escherichia coli]|nr:hypothetical protein [Escherichia coli]
MSRFSISGEYWPTVWHIDAVQDPNKGGYVWVEYGEEPLLNYYKGVFDSARFYTDFYDMPGHSKKGFISRKVDRIHVEAGDLRFSRTDLVVLTYPTQKMTTINDKFLIAQIKTEGENPSVPIPIRYRVTSSAAALSFFAADEVGGVREITGAEQTAARTVHNTEIYAGANDEGIKELNGRLVPINITIDLL